MDTKLMLDYLLDLEFNNDRAWYHAHKPEKEAASREFESLVQALLLRFSQHNPDVLHYRPKELIFRLMRDTRFSHNKQPYNPSFRFHIGPEGKRFFPVGFFLAIKPRSRSMIGGGLFHSDWREATKAMRAAIANNSAKWKKIVTNPEFAKQFTVKGEALKKVPKEYEPDHPMAEYLKMKSWYVEFDFTDELVQAPDFLDKVAELYRIMQPFNAFINEVLQGFSIPER